MCQNFPAIQLREGVSSSKFVFTPTLIFCSLIIVVQFFCENKFWFSRNDFSRSTAQICKFSPWILPELCDLVHEFTWPPVFLSTQSFVLSSKLNPLFYPQNLILCHCWSWQRDIYFLVNTFVQHTFHMSKSSIKTKTVLTMTDITESTKLLAFKRQMDSYKVTVNIYLCICVVPSWDELRVRQNLLAIDYEIHMVCLLTTVYCHKLLQ